MNFAKGLQMATSQHQDQTESIALDYLKQNCQDHLHHLIQTNATNIPRFNLNLINSTNKTLKQTTILQNAQPLTKFMLNNFQEPAKSLDKTIDYYFNDFWVQYGDERTSQMPFMAAGPWKLIWATIIYLYLIKVLIPKMMQNRKAFELTWLIRGYNLLMVISNMYAFYHGARILKFGIKCFGCEVINQQDYSPEGMELLYYGWLFVLSRLVEWLDTIFFVLRKKDKQVTKLHVFHHSFVPIFCWVYLKFLPGYTVAFFPFVNTFVHTIMYNYYFLATFGPSIQPYLWWKKYLTSLQIAQFVCILIQLITIPLSMDEKCQYPRSFLIVAFGGAILFLWLFYTYYIDTYKSTSKSEKKSPSSCRDGTSKALSEFVDNAIVCPDSSKTSKESVVVSKVSNKKLV